MTIEQYNEKIKFLNTVFENAKKEVGRDFAISKNTVKIGDIIKDNIGSIKVEVIRVYFSDLPECVYTGVELRKDNTPNKKGTKRSVFQTNILLK
jgi:hypothetical protein